MVSVVFSPDQRSFTIAVNGAVCIEQRTDTDGKTGLTPARAQALAAQMVAELEAAQQAAVVQLPELVITALNVSAPGWAEGTTEATLIKGTKLIPVGELQMGGQKVPVSARFRMPITATDGRERLILAILDQGTLTAEWTPSESGTWRVTEEAINRALPPEARMRFAGLTILVLD